MSLEAFLRTVLEERKETKLDKFINEEADFVRTMRELLDGHGVRKKEVATTKEKE